MEIYNDSYSVYVHTNKINGKKYVGQTVQIPQRRWREGKGYPNNQHFQGAIEKYGWDNFDHEIIASNLTFEEADNFEKLLIEKLDTINPDKGYNLTYGGGHSFHHSEQTRKKISQLTSGANNPMYGVHRWGSKNPNSKTVKCIETNMIYSCVIEAEKDTGISRKAIAKCCRGRSKTSGGYHWEYV